jgi:hypothetical protein
MTIAFPGRATPSDQLPFISETTLDYGEGVFVDLREDSGEWYGSFRINPPHLADAVGYCDVWRGPHSDKSSAIKMAWLLGMIEAQLWGVQAAEKLPITPPPNPTLR